MKPSKLFRVLAVIAAVASLSACGGGGGGGDSASQTPPTPPANTGLSAPTLTLSQDINSVNPLVQEMTLTYGLADEAQATNALGSLGPAVGTTVPPTFNCTSGNITFTQNASGNLVYTYTNCSDSTYTYNGTSEVTRTIVGGVVTSYQVSFSGLQVTGTPGLASPVSGTLTCTPAATAGQSPSCTASVGGYAWGHDIGYAGGNGTANGTHQCNCVPQGTWNVTFKDFTATGGVAEVFATNGSAIVTRTGAKTFTVVMFVGGVVQTYNVTLP